MIEQSSKMIDDEFLLPCERMVARLYESINELESKLEKINQTLI